MGAVLSINFDTSVVFCTPGRNEFVVWKAGIPFSFFPPYTLVRCAREDPHLSIALEKNKKKIREKLTVSRGCLVVLINDSNTFGASNCGGAAAVT